MLVDVDVDVDADVMLLGATMVDENSLVVTTALGRVADAAAARKPETPIGMAEEKRRSMMVMVMEGAKLLSFIPRFCVARLYSEDSCVSMGCPVK